MIYQWSTPSTRVKTTALKVDRFSQEVIERHPETFMTTLSHDWALCGGARLMGKLPNIAYLVVRAMCQVGGSRRRVRQVSGSWGRPVAAPQRRF
jgi:hypothetical protein